MLSLEQTTRLPTLTIYDHKIKLIEEAETPFGPLYAMSEQELEGLQE